MLELFDYYRSTASYRVRITLNLKGIEHKRTVVHLVKDGGQQHSESYKEVNPSALVPTLRLEDGTFLTQSLAIIEYLNEAYPAPAILPIDSTERAKVRGIANIIASDIHPINNLRILQYLQNELKISDDNKDEWYRNWINKGFVAIESLLSKYKSNGNFCFGNSVSMADIFLIPQVYNANRFNCPLDSFPLIKSINDNCIKLEAFSKANPNTIGDE